mmetsp:Transcript_8855/g.16722  ORF Transcript_8855/g.16722 Transcript_8855/m.16722 type:complete len:105 (-) Transcript_8855:789-1103(-)
MVGKLDGIEVGKLEGLDAGKDEGAKVGKLEGLDAGKVEGAAVGKLEGLDEGTIDGIEEVKLLEGLVFIPVGAELILGLADTVGLDDGLAAALGDKEGLSEHASS